MKIFKRFIAAFAFLTICPIPGGVKLAKEDIGRSGIFFPVVGLVLGLIYSGIAGLLHGRPFIAAIAVVATGAMLTRALHLDGVADLADALGGGTTRIKRLEILRDSRIGTFGTVAVCIVLLVKFAALMTLFEVPLKDAGITGFTMLIIPAVAGRWVMVWLLQFFPYARSMGKGSAFDKNRNPVDIVVAGLLAAVVCLVTGGAAGAVIFVAITAATHLFGIAVAKKLGGLTGDVYGAACELIEAVVFVIIAVYPVTISHVFSLNAMGIF